MLIVWVARGRPHARRLGQPSMWLLGGLVGTTVTAILLPDLVDGTGRTRHLAVGAGKDAHIYVVDRDAMGKWNPNNNDNLYQQLTGALAHGEFSMPAYFHNTVYFGGTSDNIKAFPIVNGRLASSPSSKTSLTFFYPGVTPSISANLDRDGVLWAVENTGHRVLKAAVLHAYNPLNLTQELYNSNQQASRDQLPYGNKFITPTIANGRVYVGTPFGVQVFGLLQ